MGPVMVRSWSWGGRLVGKMYEDMRTNAKGRTRYARPGQRV